MPSYLFKMMVALKPSGASLKPLHALASVLGTALLAPLFVQTALANASEAKPEKLVVYSSRKEHLIKPLFDLYQQQTGIKIDYITGKAGPLITRLQSEGKATKADILMTVDAGNLWHAASLGLLASVDSKVLERNIPSYLQDKDNRWFALTKRARTLVYAKDRVKPEALSTYEALADKVWDGRLCLRTSKKVYNQSLVATLIETQGESKAEQIVKGWVDNLATDPFANDTKAMQAVLAGQCDVTVVNTYYFGRLLKADPNLKLSLFWPNQQDRGVHVNISGAGVTQASQHKAAATAFLEWLSEGEAQKQFAELNQEFPANPKVRASKAVEAWGTFKEDTVAIEVAGKRQRQAIELMDRVGYR